MVTLQRTLKKLGGASFGAVALLSFAALPHGLQSSTKPSSRERPFNEELESLGRSLFFAHRSAELGHRLVLERCGAFENVDATALLDLGMRLGEGSGAALAMSLLRAGAALMRDMATFESAQISAGDQAEQHGV